MILTKAKSYLLTGTAGVAIAPMLGMAGASVASAADMAVKAPPPPPPVAAPSWAGFYIGANVGGASESSFLNDPEPDGIVGNGTRTGSAFIGGGQIGYNWQQGTFVYGLEADMSGLTSPSALNFASPSNSHYTYGSHVPWLATIRGRVGVTVGDGMTLLYGTGGVAIGRVKAFANECFYSSEPCHDYSATRTGWTAGGGIERMIAPHWTAGVEGLFVDLGSYSASGAGGKCCTTVHDKVLIGRFKVNYKF